MAWVEPLGGWLVTRRDLVAAAMRDDASFTVEDERFSTGRVVGASMLTLEGAEHDRHRAPWARPFRRAAVSERFGELVPAEAARLLDAASPARGMELRREFAGPLAARIVQHALGLGAVPTAAVLSLYAAIVAAVTRVTAGEPVPPAGRAAFAALREAILPVLGADPARSLLAAAAAGGGLAPGEVVANAAVMLFGGIETTEGMIANAAGHLLTHPEALARVRADPALLTGAIEESLRLEPAAASIDRYTTREVELGGARIAGGELVVLSLAGANRDPAAFPDPDRFLPERADARRHLAFAGGPHVCIGMHLARLEAEAALRLLLDRPGIRLAPGADFTPRGLVFRKPARLDVVWD